MNEATKIINPLPFQVCTFNLNAQAHELSIHRSSYGKRSLGFRIKFARIRTSFGVYSSTRYRASSNNDFRSYRHPLFFYQTQYHINAKPYKTVYKTGFGLLWGGFSF
jgi:hypothetical protein